LVALLAGLEPVGCGSSPDAGDVVVGAAIATGELNHDTFRRPYEAYRGPIENYMESGICDSNPSICRWSNADDAYLIEGNGDITIRYKSFRA